LIGYDKAADIAHIASETGETILDVAKRETDYSEKELKVILNPKNMTELS
jgi:aspartate ammonia-lyase